MNLFGDPGYVRGRLTLEALRQRVGDRDMTTLLRTWAKRYVGRSVTTSQLVALAEGVIGEDLAAFFRIWLEVPAKPAGYQERRSREQAQAEAGAAAPVAPPAGSRRRQE